MRLPGPLPSIAAQNIIPQPKFAFGAKRGCHPGAHQDSLLPGSYSWFMPRTRAEMLRYSHNRVSLLWFAFLSKSQEWPAPQAYIIAQIAPQMARLFDFICFQLVPGGLTKLGDLGSSGNHAPHDDGTERAVWAL